MDTNISIRVRKANADDYEAIFKLVKNTKINCFGKSRLRNYNAKDFFKKYAIHRLLCYLEEDPSTVIAYAETCTFPDIRALPMDCTMEFLKKHYCIDLELNAMNTLFLNYLVVLREYRIEALKVIFAEIFVSENQIQFIVVIEPPLPSYSVLINDSNYLHKKITRIDYFMLCEYEVIYYPRIYSAITCIQTQKLHVIMRDRVLEVMKYRRALPEDNDDIIDIIDQDLPEMKEALGDYFIAEELLEYGNPHSMIVVCEIRHITTGFFWLNNDLDIVSIVQNFETEPYGNLIKFSPEQPHETLLLNKHVSKRGNSRHWFTSSGISGIFDASYIGKFLVQSEVSGLSLSSQCNLNVVSTSGQITTSNERFYLHEEFYKKLQKLNEKLLSSTYYKTVEEENLLLYYNVPEEGESEEGEENKDEIQRQSLPMGFTPNAVALQLFGILKTCDYRRIFTILLAAFSAYPEREYVLLSVPRITPIVGTLREMLRFFVEIPPRPCGNINDKLFIAQRTPMYSDIKVEHLRLQDISKIDETFYNFPKTTSDRGSGSTEDEISDDIIEADLVHKILDDILLNPFTKYKCILIRCGYKRKTKTKGPIVGVVILRPLETSHIFSAHFERLHWEAWQDEPSRAEIVLFRLNEFYIFLSDIIMRQVSRLSLFTDFYYVQPLRGPCSTFTNNLILRMQPVEPIRYKNFCEAHPLFSTFGREVEDTDVHPQLNLGEDHFALYRHNLGVTKMMGSGESIVVIGFSALCQAVLRLLIFNWNVNDRINPVDLNCLVPELNITAIVEPGVIEAAYDANFLCAYCEKQTDCWVNRIYWSDFVQDCTQRIDLRNWVRFVSGKVEKIERERKHVVMKDGCEVYYDILLLLCETDFNLPNILRNVEVLPPNFVQVNTRLDRILIYHKICIIQEQLMEIATPKILVYGSHLRALEFVDFLITHNIDPDNIILVMPYQLSRQDAQKILNQPVADGKIECIVTTMLFDMGVQIFELTTLSHWVKHKADDSISHGVFYDSGHQEITIECDLFINYYECSLDWQTIEMLNCSGIKTNRRNILVNKGYCTNDPCIYAMGDYVECDEEPNFQYKFVSHLEQAKKLIQILELFPERINIEEPHPRFVQPHSLQVHLPQGYELIKIVHPKAYIANHLTNEFTRSLVTYDGTFCRIRLDQHGIVEEFVCVTKKRMSFEFLLLFVGHHETLLNYMRVRWCQKEIECFIDFFQEPWAELIIHERFPELLKQNREFFIPNIASKIDLNIPHRDRANEIFEYARARKIHHQMENILLKFLHKYRLEFFGRFTLPGNKLV